MKRKRDHAILPVHHAPDCAQLVLTQCGQHSSGLAPKWVLDAENAKVAGVHLAAVAVVVLDCRVELAVRPDSFAAPFCGLPAPVWSAAYHRELVPLAHSGCVAGSSCF